MYANRHCEPAKQSSFKGISGLLRKLAMTRRRDYSKGIWFM
jgi:hypothetical protein